MRKNNGEKGMIPVFIMGITLYLLIFEGRSKYLYMFLPVFLVGADLGIQSAACQFNQITERFVKTGFRINKGK